MSRDPLLYLDDIVQAAEKIQRTVTNLSFEAFCDNRIPDIHKASHALLAKLDSV